MFPGHPEANSAPLAAAAGTSQHLLLAALGLPAILAFGKAAIRPAPGDRGEENRTMEMDLTTANAAAGLKAEPIESEVFGIRPDTGRPHSISLQAAARAAESQPGSRGLDLLIGVGIGAAVMYYLDPELGPARRARVRGVVAETLTMAPEAFDDAAREVTIGAARLLAASGDTWSGSTATTHASWSSGARLLAGAIGTALTFLGGRRRDALGAAAGVLGSALLARGLSSGQAAGETSRERATDVRHNARGGFDGAPGA
jgi:hypothetical protein